LKGDRSGLITGLTLAATLAAGGGATAQPLAARPELSALSGTWYEVAAYGSWWQRRCVRDNTLVVVVTAPAEADLRSRCRTAASVELRNGRLRASGDDGRWKARFAPAFFAWLPAVWGDFWVVGYDPAVTWLVVGERDHQRLAVFSRTAAIDEAALAQAMAQARRAGFDPARLTRVRHDPDEWRSPW
jgi:apolipoprotein D and lipocalin family protein